MRCVPQTNSTKPDANGSLPSRGETNNKAAGAFGRRFGVFFKNPYRAFVALTHRGFFQNMEDERYLRLLYRGVMGYKLHLHPPRTYCEKLQWLKLYDKNPLYPTLCDKIAVREFVRMRGAEAYLTPLLGVWESPDDIDFSALPERFALKCTHDSGGVVLCQNRAEFDEKTAREKLKQWLGRDYSIAGREWPYRLVPRRVLAEEYLPVENGARPDDYKFYCFDGKVQVILVCTNRVKSHADYLYFDTSLRPFRINEITASLAEDYVLPAPAHLFEMIALSERLSAGFKHIRVDLYDTQQGVRFGEMTLYDQSGFADDFSFAGDLELGKLLDLSDMK